MRKAALSIISAISMLWAGSAQADYYKFGMSSLNGTLIGFGYLITEDEGHYFQSPGGFTWFGKTIIDMGGSLRGEQITFFQNPYAPSPYQVGNYIFNNQLLEGAPAFLDEYGVLISTPGLGPINLLGLPYPDPGPTSYLMLRQGSSEYVDFDLTPAIPMMPLPGGSMDDPTPLPTGMISGVSGNIGPGSEEQFYSFYWAGGLFSATASMIGATPDQAFQFYLGGMGVPASYLKLNEANFFMGTLSANLVAGTYTVGLFGVAPVDPAFTISFDTPVGMAVPEAESWLLMILGFGAAGGAIRRKRPLRRSEPGFARV